MAAITTLRFVNIWELLRLFRPAGVKEMNTVCGVCVELVTKVALIRGIPKSSPSTVPLAEKLRKFMVFGRIQLPTI